MLEKIILDYTWKVIGVDMAVPTKIQELFGADKDRFEFHQMDIAEPESLPQLRGLISRADTVINLAAICNPSEYLKRPVDTIHSNFTDARAIIDACVALKKHLVHFSTCEVYGRTLRSYGVQGDDARDVVLDEVRTSLSGVPLPRNRAGQMHAKPPFLFTPPLRDESFPACRRRAR